MPEHAAPPASAVPRAATVLVLRTADSTPSAEVEVLLVRRSHRASFMANAYVFPGGRIDAADAAEPDGGTAPPLVAARRAAARELSEEVGLQVGDSEKLIRFAHWITPSAEPKRFDTEFFLWPLLPRPRDPAAPPDAPLPPPPQVQIDGREVFDPLWLTPAAALARYLGGTLNLPPPTASTLEDLAAEIAAARMDLAGAESLLHALLARCGKRRPLPTLPKFFADDRGLAIVMPWDPQYPELPGEGSPQPALAENAAPVPRRIRRCLLKLESVASAPAPAPAAGENPAGRPGLAAAPTAAVPWAVERAEDDPALS